MIIKSIYKNKVAPSKVKYIQSTTYSKKELEEARSKLYLLEITVKSRSKRGPEIYFISEKTGVASDFGIPLNIDIKAYNGEITGVELKYNPKDPPVKGWKLTTDFERGLVEILEPFKEGEKDRTNRVFKIHKRGIGVFEKMGLDKRL